MSDLIRAPSASAGRKRALALLENEFRGRRPAKPSAGHDLGVLLEQAARLDGSAPFVEPVRVIRHLACTGGTLISKGLQAQPNTLVLSEVDPFNTAHRDRRKQDFAPTDLLRLADNAPSGLDERTKSEMFEAALKALHSAMSRQGRRIVVREHSSGRYCTKADPAATPSPAGIVAKSFPVLVIVTVRHPLDSWLSLNTHGWRHFEPFTLDEYALRCMAFLDDCEGAPLFRYEDFTQNPDGVMQEMCDALELPFNSDWQALLPVLRMSGDSGRSSAEIKPRTRRPVPEEIMAAASKSEPYAELCERLRYVADPDHDQAPPEDGN